MFIGRPVSLARRAPSARSLFTSAQCLAKPAAAGNDKAYSATLLLPKTDFPLKHKDAVAAEMRFRGLTTDQIYRSQHKTRKGNAKPWVLHDGPPYANGNLHIGHALNKILKDFINRYKLLRGYRVNYIPGWDCHGLPIEHKALKALGKSHTSLSPTAVRQTARETALDAIETQKHEFRQLGVMADWDGPNGTYRTLDHTFEMRQLDLFKGMVEKGFIHHRLRPTYYSPSSRTALAEAELSYKDGHKSQSVYVAFPVGKTDMSQGLRNAWEKIDGSRELSLAVWTTTPWTLPANMGVTVNSEMRYAIVEANGRLLVVAVERIDALNSVLGDLKVHSKLTGDDLIGTRYTHLFQPPSASKPQVFAAKYVTATSGTGLVHTAPAHGQEDYEAFRTAFPESFSVNLTSPQLRCPVDDDGKFTKALVGWATDQAAAERLVGLSVLGDGVGAVIDMLRTDGCLLAQEEIEHRYPCDWKTKEPIIIRATPQWFADIDAVKSEALKAMDDIKFHPERSRKRLESFVMSRSEWCISRQRSWGLPIPAIYDVATGEPTLSSESLQHILAVLQAKGTDHWWSSEVDEFIPPHLRDSGRTFRKGTDTMDVWFDSGSSWKLIKEVMGDERSPSEPVADVYLEGSDQHRGWFQSSLLTRLSEAKQGEAGTPFANLITHGFVLDESGTKMSKSIGNTLSPMDVINGGKDRKKMPAYGSDTLRIWAAFVEYSRDVSIGPSSISQSAEVLRKLRNTMRFLIANAATDRESRVPLADVQISLIDRYVLHEVAELEKLAIENYDAFIFNRIVQAINTFTTTTLSAFYFDVAKDILYADARSSRRRQAVIAVLQHVLDRLTKIIAPVVPHLAEEIHATTTKLETSVFADEWTPQAEQWLSPVVKNEMGTLLAVRDGVMSLVEEARASKHLKLSQESHLTVTTRGTSAVNELLLQHENILPTLFGVSGVTLHSDKAEEKVLWVQSSTVSVEGIEVSLRLTPTLRHRCPRCWLYNRQSDDETLCSRCTDVLS